MADSSTLRIADSNRDAAAAWNGDDGAHWVRNAGVYDRSVARYHGAFLAAARIAPRDRVLDIGCGSGQTTRDAARIAHLGTVLGVDISRPLIENARRTAQAETVTNASFVQADAQVHPFEPASFDVAISRTGAMFFGDAGAAFTNVARALRRGGRLALLVWQTPDRNEWVTNFSAALLAGRPPAPPPPPDAPGPFSLADPDRVRSLLDAAGFAGVELEGVAEPMWFGEHAEAAFAFVGSLGFTRWMLSDLDDDGRSAALSALREDIEAHAAAPDGVVYESAMWIVTATRS